MPDPAQFDTFTIERRYAASPGRVYRALTDPRAKAAWFSGPDGWDEHERRMDARPGGTERVVGRHPSGMVSAFDAVYMDLVPDARLIFAYTMHIDGKLISCSLATWELRPDGAGTLVVLTEQGSFLNGYVDAGSRVHGTTMLLNSLDAALGEGPALESAIQLAVPPARAFEAFTDVEQLVRWWGPDGFTATSHAFDFREGGSWDMTMHGPDGTDYPNLYRYHVIESPARVVVEHPDPAHWFEATATLEPADGGTRLTWRQRFDSEEHLAEIKDFLTIANAQLLARLKAVVGSQPHEGLSR